MHCDVNNLRETVEYKSILEHFSRFKQPEVDGKSYIVLDGTLATSANLHLQTAIGLAARDVLDLNICFLTDNDSLFLSDIAKNIGASIWDVRDKKKGVYKNKLQKYYNKLQKYYNKFLKKFRLGMCFYGSLEAKKFKNICIEDLIYDDIIRNNDGIYTDSGFCKKDILNTRDKAFFNFVSASKLFREKNISYISLHHKFYATLGVFSRVALHEKIKFISGNRARIKLIKPGENILVNDFSIDSKLAQRIDAMSLSDANKYNQQRINGETYDHDILHAYTDKHSHDKNDLLHIMGINESKPIGVIFAHAFSDAPHSDSQMIYSDYYAWFVETLKLIAGIDEVHWLVKPHPSSSVYHEEGEVAKLISEIDHCKMVPADVDTTSILKMSDAAITVRGTVGLEAVEYDNCVILAGSAYYQNLGYTVNCNDEDSYLDALRGIKKKVPYSQNLKDKIAKVLFWRMHSYFYFSNIFGPERMPNMSEQSAYEHEFNNYKHVYNALLSTAYEDDEYFKLLKKFFKGEINDISAIDFSYER